MEKVKSNKGKKIAKIVLLILSFILTAVITFSVTLAWFYDGDWASDMVTMAGTVGIHMEDRNGPLSSDKPAGAGQLSFYVTTDKAYPGQAVDMHASVRNDGGASETDSDPNTVGSQAYIRARFVVYTNLGTGIEDQPTNPENLMNSRAIYNYLKSLIDTENGAQSRYNWIYHKQESALPLKGTGESGTIQYYYNGVPQANSTVTEDNQEGYYYLCYKPGASVFKKDGTTSVTLSSNDVLKPLAVNEAAAFLWNSEFIIPWTLTNASADKKIFVAVQFQAIQTFIPQVNQTGAIDGIIKPGLQGDNQVDPTECTITNGGVQTIFNSIDFGEISLEITKDGVTTNFGTNPGYNGATSQTNSVTPKTA